MPRNQEQHRIQHILQQANQDLMGSRDIFGMYRGIVEDNRDPFGLGRCKVARLLAVWRSGAARDPRLTVGRPHLYQRI